MVDAPPTAAPRTPLLSVRGLVRAYDEPVAVSGLRGAVVESARLEVLCGIDLDIEAGDMVSIVGRSGAGKSTLLQILGTLDRPTAGEVRYHGESVFALSPARLAAFRNRHIGFIFQFHHLLAELTALENVTLPLLIAGVKPREAERVALEHLGLVGLAARATHKPGQLSGGEAQRVAIARALVRKPDIVFADEPTGNLDTRTSDDIHALLVDLNARLGTAFVVVTHNVKLAWLMRRHLLLADGHVRELRDDEAPDEFLPRRENP
jgi:lipoprotein-releasing system ATP-binding protein